MIKYEELKYVLSGATDWGYEYAKKEDVEAAFAELEERHAMELDQWVLELGKMKLENERLKKDIDTLKTAWEQSQSALSTIAALKFAAEEKHRASHMALCLLRVENARMNWLYIYFRRHEYPFKGELEHDLNFWENVKQYFRAKADKIMKESDV